MKPPVCVKCQIQLRKIKVGVAVIDMFSHPPKPYQVWLADLFECPICKTRIVSAFADNPLGRYFEGDFGYWVHKAGGGFQVYNYEYVADAAPPAGA